MTEIPYAGGCLCGAVRIEARGEPYRVGICHCLDCRKNHAAPFQAFAMFPADHVTVTGETGCFARNAVSRRYFCPQCGSPVFARDKDSDEIEVFLGSLDEPNRLRPTYELWIGRREAWLPEIDVARRYDHNREGKGRSEP
jgi:hypothetical protein